MAPPKISVCLQPGQVGRIKTKLVTGAGPQHVRVLWDSLRKQVVHLSVLGKMKEERKQTGIQLNSFVAGLH